MALGVLWFDNDRSYLTNYVEALSDCGYEVQIVTTIPEAEAALNLRSYALVILDVMLPTKNEAEEVRYPPELTDKGHRTGLAFFQQWKAALSAKGTMVLVLTVRLDDDICKEFIALGLPRNNFATKLSLADVGEFVKRVAELTHTT